MSKTVMIVEDEPLFHELYEKMLEDTNYELVRLETGQVCLWLN